MAITKHDAPKAVLISYDEFRALMRARAADLGGLESRFDALLAGMQTRKSRAAMSEAFEADPARLARAAVKAVRKRRGRKAG